MINVLLKSVQYGLPDPPSKLPHKRMNLFEWLMSLLVQSHVCQICGRKEIWSVSGWLQIDHPRYKDSNGCSSVCLECARRNPEVFQ